MDLGFIQAGFEVVGANEYEESATLTYLTNLASYPVQIHYIEGEKDKDRLNKACERYIFGGKVKSVPAGIVANEKHDTPGGLYNAAMGSGLAGSGWIRHHPEAAPVRNFFFGNVRKLTGKMILDALGMKPGELDCVCGGPPCQGYSAAGKQNIADPRNNLVYEYGRLIVELQPKTFVMEEVPAIVGFFDPDGVPVLDKFALMLQEGGYGKWDQIKKAMMMQAGAVAVIKNGDVKKMAGKPPPKVPKKPQHEDSIPNQISLFDEATI